MSLVAAISSIFVAPQLEVANLVLRVIAAIVATFGFYAVFATASKLLVIWRHRKVLGNWYYATNSFEAVDFKDANFAKMRFFLNDDNDLDYRVTTYRSLKALLDTGTEASTGTAESRALRHDTKRDLVDVVYSFRFSSEKSGTGSRDGRLSLRFLGKDHMEGDWTSEASQHKIEDSTTERVLSSGMMLAGRPKNFVRLIENRKVN